MTKETKEKSRQSLLEELTAIYSELSEQQQMELSDYIIDLLFSKVEHTQ